MAIRPLTVLLTMITLCCAAAPVWAHSPYFGEVHEVDHPEFGQVTLAMLYGDGLFFADPRQVVVYDQEGRLLAATPWSVAQLIRCGHNAGQLHCSVYDVFSQQVFEPNYDSWVRRRPILEDERPSRDAFPDQMNIAYGFTPRPATALDTIVYEGSSILGAPAFTLIAVVWWCVAWLVPARLIWLWRRNGWRIHSVQGRTVALTAFGLVVMSLMSVLALFGWAQEPYSIYFFLFVFLLGLGAAFLLMRPRRTASEQT